MTITPTAGEARLDLDPDDGVRFTSLTVAGHELLVTEGDRPFEWGSFVMAPWAGRIRRGRAAWDGRRLDLRLEVEATGGPVPATVGWHPWFRREIGGSTLELDLRAGWMLERDPDHIASERRVAAPPQPWDDTFGGISWPITLTWPQVLALEIVSDGPVAVVYTPDHAVCVEPQTGPPDEVNHDRPRLAERGRPLTLASTWRWR